MREKLLKMAEKMRKHARFSGCDEAVAGALSQVANVICDVLDEPEPDPEAMSGATSPWLEEIRHAFLEGVQSARFVERNQASFTTPPDSETLWRVSNAKRRADRGVFLENARRCDLPF